MVKDGTGHRSIAVRDEAALIAGSAQKHGLPAEALFGLIEAARREARERRRRIPAGEVEQRVDEIVSAGWKEGRT